MVRDREAWHAGDHEGHKELDTTVLLNNNDVKFWTSLVVQMVKNLPTMRKIQIRPWVRNIPWSRAWQPTPVSLSGEFYGQRSLVGYSP